MNNNSNLKVRIDLGVEINKARVELNNDQRAEVSKFVTSLLFGKNFAETINSNGDRPRSDKKNSRVFGRKAWTREEETRFMDLARQYGPESRNQTQLFRMIGREMGRTPLALLNRLSAIRRGKGELAPTDVPTTIPSERGWKARNHGASPVNEGPSNMGPSHL